VEDKSARLNTILLVILNLITGIGAAMVWNVTVKVERIDRSLAAVIQKIGGVDYQ